METKWSLKYESIISDSLPKTIKDGTYIINFDGYADVGTHWIALYVKNMEVIYFDTFGIEHFLWLQVKL